MSTTKETDKEGFVPFGYTDTYLAQRGNVVKQERQWAAPITEPADTFPSEWKIMTFNLWGLGGGRSETANELLRLRMKLVCEEIKTHNPDLLFLQEMSHRAAAFLVPFLKTRYEYVFNTVDSVSERNMKTELGRELCTHVMCKYVPHRAWKYGISGNLGYTAPVDIALFGDLCVVGVHLQAGSKASPGKAGEWVAHFQRCRKEQLETVAALVKTLTGKSPAEHKRLVLCGDFNFDLDATKEEKIEHDVLRACWPGLTDAWLSATPREVGFTEDTKTNTMRWNVKRKEKQVRCDGILFKGMRASEVSRVGTVGHEMDKELFANFLKECCGHLTQSEGIVVPKPREALYFASDHYGVVATLE